MGMVAPTAGEIVLETDGRRVDLTRVSTEEIVSLGIALVPEGRRLFPKLTVEENLLLGAYRPQARAEIGANLELSFEAFPVLAQRRRQLAGSMSRGELPDRDGARDPSPSADTYRVCTSPREP